MQENEVVFLKEMTININQQYIKWMFVIDDYDWWIVFVSNYSTLNWKRYSTAKKHRKLYWRKLTKPWREWELKNIMSYKIYNTFRFIT